MSFVVDVPYYAITEDDYLFLIDVMGVEFMNAQNFQPYTQGGNTYYLTLKSEIDQDEALKFADKDFPTELFGIAYFTNSVQANITFPGD